MYKKLKELKEKGFTRFTSKEFDLKVVDSTLENTLDKDEYSWGLVEHPRHDYDYIEVIYYKEDKHV